MAQISDYFHAILIEKGNYNTHCGFVGDDYTKLSFRTPLISTEAQLKNIFEKILNLNPAQYRVVIVKDAGTPQQVLKDEARLLFTKFNVKACAFITAQLGIIFSWVEKEPNGLIIDIGYLSTKIVPILDLKIKI